MRSHRQRQSLLVVFGLADEISSANVFGQHVGHVLTDRRVGLRGFFVDRFPDCAAGASL